MEPISPKKFKFVRFIEKVILGFSFIIFIIIWFTLGLTLWVSMLLRTMAFMTLVVFAALLKGKDLSGRINIVNQVADIWPHGLIVAYKAFILGEKPHPKNNLSDHEEIISTLFLEIVWAVIVYGAIIWLLFFQDGILLSLLHKLCNAAGD